MSNIPVSSIERDVKHPAWTPVSVDGTAVTGAMPDDYQPLGIGAADKTVGALVFKGDAGQMFTLSGVNSADKIEDHSGDGDDVAQMRSVDFETPGSRTLSCVVPAGWGWVPALIRTVFHDAAKRPMTIRDTYSTGKTVSQQFLVASFTDPIAGADVLKIECELTPYGGATETGLA